MSFSIIYAEIFLIVHLNGSYLAQLCIEVMCTINFNLAQMFYEEEKKTKARHGGPATHDSRSQVIFNWLLLFLAPAQAFFFSLHIENYKGNFPRYLGFQECPLKNKES